MRYILCILFGTFGAGCASSQSVDVAKLEWLVGTWSRTQMNPGKSGHERWEKVSENELRGWGVSFNGPDTSYVEKLRIYIENGNTYYVADVPENSQPVPFKITVVSEVGFVCENPSHDFPKRIEYKRKEAGMTAVISGDGRSMSFSFAKQ